MIGNRINGKVKWFDPKKGFGFIQTDSGREVFVHFTAILGRGYRTLNEAEEVEFEVEDNPKGCSARAVKRVQPAPLTADTKR